MTLNLNGKHLDCFLNCRRLRLFFFILLFFFLFFEQNLFSKSLPVYLDYAIFRKNEKENILEVYYGFIDNKLSYYKQGKKYVVELLIDLKLFENDSLVDSYNWIVYHEKDKLDTAKDVQNLLVGQKNFLIKSSSKVKFEFVCIDSRDSSNRYRKTFDVDNIDFSQNQFNISNIQIAQFIERSDTASVFWQHEFLKSKYYIVPNPTLEIIGSNLRLFTYFEYYINVNPLPKEIKIEYRIYNTIQEEVLYSFRNVKVVNSSQFDINGFALDAISSGTYFFEATIAEKDGRIISRSKRKKFYLLNAELPPEPIRKYTEPELFEKSIFTTLDERSLDLEFEKAKYIASDYEKELYKNLSTVEAKRRFLFQFWSKRNPDSLLVYNKAYDDFNQKINYANRFFSVGNQIEGWKTDRARILIQYGEPTSREYHPREPNKRSYEIWFYSELQGGAYFYFVDIAGNGNYLLVHSTAINEPYNENWYTDFVTGTNTERLQKMFLNR